MTNAKPYSTEDLNRRCNEFIHENLMDNADGDTPDYLKDADAIRNAEKKIQSKGYDQEYKQALDNVTFGTPYNNDPQRTPTTGKAFAIMRMLRILEEQNS